MKQRSVGNTGLKLTEISYGGSAIGNLYQTVSPEAAYDVLETSWEAGIRYFDTAPFYGHGLSERRLGDFLRSRKEYVLSSKVGRILTPVPDDQVPDHGFIEPLPFDFYYDYSYDGIMRSYTHSLARLGLNKIDILYAHDLEPRGFDEVTYQRHLHDFLTSGISALNELKSQGAIGAYGIGVNQVSACINVIREADIDLILLAGRYTLLDRTAEAVLLKECNKRGISLVIGGVFNSGILATGPRQGAYFDYEPANEDILKRVQSIQSKLEMDGVNLARAALQFPLQNDLVASVLIGSAKASSMTRNVRQYSQTVSRAAFDGLEDFTLKGYSQS